MKMIKARKLLRAFITSYRKAVYHAALAVISYCQAVYHAVSAGNRYIICWEITMTQNKLLDLSFEFAVTIVNLVDGISVPKSTYMTAQISRSGTSIGANVHEAQYAQSRKDFVSKLEIALKETSETSYWLKLMYYTGRISEQDYYETEKMCGNIRRLLIASCRTAKEKLNDK